MQSRWNFSHSFLLAIVLVFSSSAVSRAQGSTTTQEQRVTEQRTLTGEDGRVSKTSEVIERKIEDITPPARHLISAAPVRMIWMANIGYMHSINNNFAIGGNIDIPTSIDGRSIDGRGVSGFGVSVEGRYYPGANGLRGFYLAPGLNVHTFSVTEYSNSYISSGPPPAPRQVSITPFSFAVIGGWVFNWGDLSLDLGLGFKSHISNGASPSATSTLTPYSVGERGLGMLGLDSFNGTMPVFRINLGYSW